MESYKFERPWTTRHTVRSSSRQTLSKTCLLALALVALLVVMQASDHSAEASVMDYEYLDLRDLYDLVKQNELRAKKSPRAEKSQPLRMRFGRRSDPLWSSMSGGPIPQDNSNNNFVYNVADDAAGR
ncbi:hypothetical protein GZH46_01293 [Fragariocoptes setiger]|uniref:Uncharacterized protein n=1 Tax=Fragariocoptes setiger TaxID=1670756 RepID=A0ABQ7S9T5_9ACAR|nr:hypothetical protein GZH46_01293 [Fragariocoptes setiger]